MDDVCLGCQLQDTRHESKAWECSEITVAPGFRDDRVSYGVINMFQECGVIESAHFCSS